VRIRSSIGAIFVALFLFGAAGCGTEEPLSEADKSLFLRAADLESYGYQYKNADSHETFSKTRQFDGSYQLTYQFQTPAGERRPLYIYATVSVARSASDAALAGGAENIGMLIGLKAGGVEEREVQMQPGDDRNRLRVLLKGGKPLGNVFTARDGRKTYMLVLAGLYFEDAEDWKKLVEPKLQQLAGYSPA
jgi:hypothetical protein